MKLSFLNIKFLGSFIYLVLIILLPYNLYFTGFNSDITPAIDLIVLYFFSTYRNPSPILIYLFGFFVDKLINLPLGTSSFAFITANLLTQFTNNLIIIRDYFTNIAFFAIYCLYIMLVRYLFVNIFSDINIDFTVLVFHILTTIISYPIIKIFLTIPFKV